MNESERLADQLERALNGNAWHGPSLRESLDGVTRDAAVLRPMAEAHSIAELVLHATTWHDVVRRRLEGESPEVSDAQDWPAATAITDDAAWSATIARAFATGAALAQTVRAFPVDRLQTPRPGTDGSWYQLISGELQHVLYHTGQVAILRKAAVPARV
jgi:uncharacterized damage-inducible protein DinB